MKENVLDILKERGYIEQVTFEDDLKKLLGEKSIPFYIGFDPTADSLHVGHFVSMMVAKYMQNAGHKPIILVGGGTVTIGDPSGKTDMRKMLSKEEINHNVECCKKQLEKFISFEGENAAIIVNNADWLLDLNYIEFMRKIGSLFTINKMLAAECYKARKDEGLTFFEMGYMLMQSYDFLYLHDNYNCKLEMGGNDQWSNILGGVDLIRKVGHDDSFGLTFKLLTTKEGKKMGKTEKGALWLDKEKTSPYEFYQYWRNIADADVKTVLSMLTFIPMDEVERLSSLEGEKINEAKKIAAFEITKLVHGEEEAIKAQEASESLFGGNKMTQNIPMIKIEQDGNLSIVDALVKANFAQSKGQAKTLIMQGAISINDEKVSDISYTISNEELEKGIILKKGKKSFIKLIKE